MPGAIIRGTLGHTAKRKVPKKAARHVTVIRADLSMPVCESISGLTNMMYEAVKKVVRPANISILNEEDRRKKVGFIGREWVKKNYSRKRMAKEVSEAAGSLIIKNRHKN